MSESDNKVIEVELKAVLAALKLVVQSLRSVASKLDGPRAVAWIEGMKKRLEEVVEIAESHPIFGVKVYVAAWSDEIDRAKAAIAFLRSLGYEVTYDWTDPFHGFNDMNELERINVARAEMRGVRDAKFLWVLMPEKSGAGVHTELGIALGLGLDGEGPEIFVSGFLGRNIFNVMADHKFETDEEARAWFVEYRKRNA